MKPNGPSVLMVDDIPENLTTLEAILEPLRLDMVKATSGLQALRLLLKKDFAVVLLDVRMPTMDGFEIAEAIRGRERSRLTPIIFITAVGRTDEQVQKGYSLGAVDYIIKPFSPEILRWKVSNFVELYLGKKKTETHLRKIRNLSVRMAEVNRKLKASEEQLRKSYLAAEARYKDLVVRAGEAKEAVVLLQDCDGIEARHVFANKEWCRITGCGLDELRGKSLLEFFSQDNVETARCTIETWLSGKNAPGLRQIQVKSKSGVSTPVEIGGAPTDFQGRPAAVAYILDITEEIETKQLKDEFISMVSHEMKTPLTVVIGALGTLLRHRESLSVDDQTELINDSVLAAESLAHLVNNLLELSRSQASSLSLSLSSLNLCDLLKKMVTGMSRPYPERLFVVNCPNPCPVNADELRVERIVYNLLDNAAKYSPQGTEVTVSAEQRGSEIAVSISDRGDGISSADQEKLFVPFERLGKSSAGSAGGTGLGLIVCKRLVEAHGGRIWVESQPGAGSTFFFTLPTATEDAELFA
ncbi:MAG: response regulator [Chloroflexi bacterium]|nr:response regulator [Chloroflexota bacterium]